MSVDPGDRVKKIAVDKIREQILFTELPMGKPSRGLRLVFLFYFFSFFSFFFFFRVGKSLACHSPGKWCLCV